MTPEVMYEKSEATYLHPEGGSGTFLRNVGDHKTTRHPTQKATIDNFTFSNTPKHLINFVIADYMSAYLLKIIINELNLNRYNSDLHSRSMYVDIVLTVSSLGQDECWKQNFFKIINPISPAVTARN